MRKTLLSIMFLLILLLVPTMVFAAEGNVAKVGETEYASIEDALVAAKSSGEDVVILETINVNDALTITLDGFNITGNAKPLFYVTDGSVTVDGTGTITAPGDAFYLVGNTGSDWETTPIPTEVKIGKDVSVTAGECAIYLKGNGAKADVYGSLTSTGEYATIQGNGNDSSAKTVINIYDGAKVINENNHAIYHPQAGELNVKGGTIRGLTGIEMRAGNLVVENGTITATYEGLIVEPNGNGTTTTGAGIAIAQHNTGKAINVVVNGGTVQGYYPLNESNPQQNLEETLAGISIKVNGGKFESLDGPTAVWSDSNKLTVTGGTFNKEVKEEYLGQNVAMEIIDGVYKVGEQYSITTEEAEHGFISVDKSLAIEGEKVTVIAEPYYNTHKLKSLVVKNVTTGKEVPVDEDGTFIMPNANVVITAEFESVIVEEPEPPTKPEEPVQPEEPTEPEGEVDYILPDVVGDESVKETINSSIKEYEDLAEKVEIAIQNGEKVTISVNVNELEKDNIRDEDKQMILQTVKANQKVHQYIDISVAVKTEKETLGYLPQLTEKIKLSVEISKDLIKEGRKFFILKLHEGEVYPIEATLNGTKLEFETDQFSLFALAYEDVETSSSAPGIPQPPTEEKDDTPLTNEKDDTPKTGAINIPVYVWLTIACMAVVGIVTTKKSSKHSK